MASPHSAHVASAIRCIAIITAVRAWLYLGPRGLPEMSLARIPVTIAARPTTHAPNFAPPGKLAPAASEAREYPHRGHVENFFDVISPLNPAKPKPRGVGVDRAGESVGHGRKEFDPLARGGVSHLAEHLDHVHEIVMIDHGLDLWIVRLTIVDVISDPGPLIPVH